MKVLSKALLLAVLLMLVRNQSTQSAQAAQSAPLAQQISPMFSIKITPVEDTVRSGSEVAVKVIITNTSNHEISIAWVMGRGGGIRLNVRDSQGNQVRTMKDYNAEKNKESGRDHTLKATVNAGSVVAIRLRPGQVMSEDLFVSDLYDLHQAGIYTIQVQRTDDETGAVVKSNIITVTVTP